MSKYIRVWEYLDVTDVSSHLLIVGESTGDCSNCRTLGIDYAEAKTCPSCKTLFKYIASRTKEAARLKTKRPDLICIDFDDYRKITGSMKARNLFDSGND